MRGQLQSEFNSFPCTLSCWVTESQSSTSCFFNVAGIWIL